MHPNIDDFLIAVAIRSQFLKAHERVTLLLRNCGLLGKKLKQFWDVSRRIEHLCFIIYNEQMIFGVMPRRMSKLCGLAHSILSQMRSNRRQIDNSKLQHCIGVDI